MDGWMGECFEDTKTISLRLCWCVKYLNSCQLNMDKYSQENSVVSDQMATEEAINIGSAPGFNAAL